MHSTLKHVIAYFSLMFSTPLLRNDYVHHPQVICMFVVEGSRSVAVSFNLIVSIIELTILSGSLDMQATV